MLIIVHVGICLKGIYVWESFAIAPLFRQQIQASFLPRQSILPLMLHTPEKS